MLVRARSHRGAGLQAIAVCRGFEEPSRIPFLRIVRVQHESH